MMKKKAWIVLLELFAVAAFAGTSESKKIQPYLENSQWGEAIQNVYETLQQNPSDDMVRLQGAYALFQKNFPHSALLLLSKIPAANWKKIPQGQDRLAEVVLLMQKKSPMNVLPGRLDQIRVETAPSYLQDELFFAKGREAYEAHNYEEAQAELRKISEKSSYYGQAHYLLGAILVSKKSYIDADKEFSKVFSNGEYEQTSELWNEISSQMTSHWGANMKVIMDTNRIQDATLAAELSVMAIARIAYATKDYETAMSYYNKIKPNFVYAERAQLEKVWTLLAQNKHDDAQKLAQDLITKDSSLEAIEAYVLRALTLADAKRSEESRQQLDEFMKFYIKAKNALVDYNESKNPIFFPQFIKKSLKDDRRIQKLLKYQEGLEQEMEALRSQDAQLFPAYLKYAGMLEPLLIQAKAFTSRVIDSHVKSLIKNLEQLHREAQLIRVETFLIDRDNLRFEFKSASQQKEHDKKLISLLEDSINGVGNLINSAEVTDSRLEFRHAELLWELGKTFQITSQDEKNNKVFEKGEEIKKQAIKMAERLVSHKEFDRHPQVLFFLGFAKIEMDQVRGGVDILKQYVKEYPNHQHVPDAYRILADLKFDANDFRGALEDYKKVLNFPDTPILGYAFYKIGWCSYNLKDFPRALLGLEKSYVWTQTSGKENQWFTLQSESRRDLIKLYAEIGDHRKAREYFSKFIHTDPKPWLVELAQELDHRAQFEKSGDLYKLVIAMEPNAKENVTYQGAIIFGYYQLNNWTQVLKATKRLVEEYKPELEAPPPPQKDTKKAATESQAVAVEKILHDTVLAQLYEYKKQPDPEAIDRITELDNYYLSAFIKWPQAQMPLYMHALFLAGLKKNNEAADAFLLHWNKFEKDLKEPLREEALRNLISTLNLITEKEKPTKGAAFTDYALNLMKYSELYESLYVANQYARKISYLRATTFFRYGKSDSAVNICQKLFTTNPTDDIGKLCFESLRASYYEKKDWEGAYKWATELISSPHGATYTKILQTVREETYFLWAAEIKDDKSSAEKFEQIASDPSMSRLRDKSLYNAFIHAQKSGQRVKALALADELQKTSPQFEGLKSIAGIRAAFYQEAGDYVRALPLLVTFLANPDPSVSSDNILQARLNTGLIAEALKQRSLAIQNLSIFLQKAPANFPGIGTAKLEMNRIQKSTMSNSANKAPESATWIHLQKLGDTLKAKPLPALRDLSEKIKRGLTQLEVISKKHIDFSASDKADVDEAFEAYCSVPIFYDVTAKAILKLSENKKLSPQEKEELHGELIKIADPLQAKADEMANSCISKSAESEHVGPKYDEIIEQWQWKPHPELKVRAEKLITLLKSRTPWLDPSKNTNSEEEILQLHQQTNGNGVTGATEDTWYQLMKLRLERSQPELARLTLVDALSRYPKSAKLANAFAVIEARGLTRIGKLFQKAVDLGSPAGCANLALYHLQGSRLQLAKTTLQRCLDLDGFKDFDELRTAAKEFVK